MPKVYVVTSGSYSDYTIDRVYLDRDEAYKYVNDRQACYSDDTNDVEEYDAWEPDSRPDFYEGKVWEGYWRQGKKEKPRTQSVIDVLAWHPEHGAGVQKVFTWGGRQEYETVDNFQMRETWWAGETPPKAKVKSRPDLSRDHNRQYPSVTVIGYSKEHVEKSLHDTVAQVKAEMAGIT